MKANLLDRAIGWVAPVAGARRLRHRVAMDIMERGYDGAKSGRLNDSWNATSTSADAEIAAAGRLLRDRMRDLVRNNPHAANALSVLVAHAVGDGIVPRSKDPKINDLFAKWVNKCDAGGRLDFYGIQSIAVRGMFESGDGIVRRRRRLASDGLPVPLQLQVLETDMIDTVKEGTLPNGNTAIQGIEFSRLDKPLAYWMFRTHPGNSYYDLRSSFESVRISADDIAHAFVMDRPQVKGTPWGSPVITALYDLAGYEQAEIVRKRLEACLVGVVTGGEDGDSVGMPMTNENGDPLPPGIYDVHGARVEKFSPGMFYNAVGGRDIKFSQPAATGNYDAYKNSMLHTIAAGFRVPHSLLTGRLDGVNYSSSKIGLEHFKRMISALQWQVIIPMLCQPIWDWFIEAAYLAGEINTRDVPVEWSPPRFYSADPSKDATARIAEVRSGFKTLFEAIAETGRNPDDVLAEHAAANKKLDDLGLIFDSDPRRMSGNGQVQQVGGSDPPEEAEK